MLDFVELLVYVGHHLLERRILALALLLGDVLSLGPALRTLDGNLLRGADAGHHILALGVDEVLAVEDVLTRCGVARESHARSRVVAHVAEYHGLYRYGRTPLGGDVVELAVEDGALVHPRAEDGADGSPELVPRIGREVLAGLLLDGGLELLDQLLQVVGRQLGVVLHAALLLLGVDNLLEGVVVLLRCGLHAQHHVAVHLDEAAVGVPCEAGVARELRDGLDGLVVHTEVENSVHHAGHRGACARAYRYEQRFVLVAELAVGQPLDVLDGLLHVGTQQVDDRLLAVGVVFGADLRGDGESGRNGNANEVHLGEVGTLAAEQFAHFAVSFGLLVAEGIDTFNVCHSSSVVLKYD